MVLAHTAAAMLFSASDSELIVASSPLPSRQAWLTASKLPGAVTNQSASSGTTTGLYFAAIHVAHSLPPLGPENTALQIQSVCLLLAAGALELVKLGNLDTYEMWHQLPLNNFLPSSWCMRHLLSQSCIYLLHTRCKLRPP